MSSTLPLTVGATMSQSTTTTPIHPFSVASLNWPLIIVIVLIVAAIAIWLWWDDDDGAPIHPIRWVSRKFKKIVTRSDPHDPYNVDDWGLEDDDE
jgi:hypothetical protein